MAYKEIILYIAVEIHKVNQYMRVFSIFSGASRAARSAARGRSPIAKEIYPSTKVW